MLSPSVVVVAKYSRKPASSRHLRASIGCPRRQQQLSFLSFGFKFVSSTGRIANRIVYVIVQRKEHRQPHSGSACVYCCDYAYCAPEAGIGILIALEAHTNSNKVLTLTLTDLASARLSGIAAATMQCTGGATSFEALDAKLHVYSFSFFLSSCYTDMRRDSETVENRKS